MWKNVSKKHQKKTSLLVVKDNHFLMGLRIIILENLSSKELFSLLISPTDHHPTLWKYFDYLLPNIELPWKEIYLTAREATANSHLRCFTYKIINNLLYLDNILNILQNHILLNFKLYIYQSWERGVLNLNGWIKKRHQS